MKWAIFKASCERVNGFPVHIGMPQAQGDRPLVSMLVEVVFVHTKPINPYNQLFFFLLGQLLSCQLNLSKSILEYVLAHPFHYGLWCISY